MKTPTLYCADDSEIELPFKWAICSACNGHGKSSAYLGAYTRDDMDEAGPEFHDAYMAGDYDRTCDRCDGLGRVKVADRKRIPPAQWSAYCAQCREDRLDRSIERMERMMGA